MAYLVASVRVACEECAQRKPGTLAFVRGKGMTLAMRLVALWRIAF